MALAMAYNAAGGETQQAMAEILEFQGISLQEVNQANAALIAMLEHLDPNIQVNSANSFWVKKGITLKPDFIIRNKDFYSAEVKNLEFDDPRASDVINAWVRERTQEKIGNIVEQIERETLLFILNAVYFKGSWTVEFNRQQTRDREFTLSDGRKKQVPMMMSQSKRYMYYWGDGFEAVSLPYGSERVSMYIFLSDRDSSLEEFYKLLNRENWEDWMSQFHREEVLIILPRFKVEYDITLNDALKTLGMGIAFSPGANFEGMCSEPLFIDEVRHKTFVEVNEKGTEAAAATVVEMKKNGTTRVIVDRPFFCAIKDNESGVVLFMGSIVDP